MIILNGVKLGIVLAFLIGPVFFAIIQTSIERGFVRGVLVSLGVSISDLFYVVICCLGLIGLVNDEGIREQMAFIGGGILILFGVYYLAVKTRSKKSPTVVHIEERRGIRYILKGFVINAFSPMVPLFWIGTLSIVTIDFGYTETGDIFVFYSALLLTVLATDIAKAYLADKLRRIITPGRMKVMNAIVGVALIVFGIRLLMLGATSG
jgi:threonine/homoserine/homoserine lactone efflux protein